MTRVIFRKFSDGEIIAIFPDMPYSDHLTTCYAHNGQHGSCDRGIIDITKLATLQEFNPLHRELFQIGYDDLRVIRRWTRNSEAVTA